MSTDDPGPGRRPIAFLGLGRMGRPMSLNLARAGYPVRAWNRSPWSIDPADIGEADYRSAATPTQAGAGADVIVTMLPDLPEARAVCDGPDGALATAEPGAVVVVMGTVSPVGVREWADEIALQGFSVVDAPVSGGDVGAAEGSLSIMCGGSPEAMERVRPMLAAMGTTIRHLGPVGSGQLTKACNQIVVGATLTALAEAVVLARRGGLDVEQVLEVLGGGLAGSRTLEVKRDKLLTGRYDAGGAAAFQHKDLGFALEAGRAEGVALPLTAIVDQLYAVMRATGHGADDHSGVVQVIDLLSSEA